MFTSVRMLAMLLTVACFSSCEKKEQDFNITPKSSIIFDDLIDKTTADYPRAGTLNLKVTIVGTATSVRATSTYTAGSAKSVVVGTFPVTGNSVTISVPVTALRAAADGPIPGAGAAVPAVPASPGVPASPAIPASTRAANTYVLFVDAIGADNSTERRLFSAVITRS